MNVLVINASANREKSVTLKLTRAFLEGLGEEAEIVTTIDLNVAPCRSCFACWTKTKGACVQKDDAPEVMEKIRQADLVIWSIPLYAYGVPSHCKALMDRTISMILPTIYFDEKGISHHPGYEDGSKKTVLISSAGLPNVMGNFDGLIFAMKHMYGENTATICCAEGANFMNSRAKDVVDAYLENVKKAGQEYKAQGAISEGTQAALDALMIPAEEFVKNTNAFWGRFL